MERKDQAEHKTLTDKQLQSNRQNALKSTGPRTPQGKAAVAANALKHGIWSEADILTDIEDPDKWMAFIDSVKVDLAPEGYVEEQFADQIAQLFWRMRRVRRYETESIRASRDLRGIDAVREDIGDHEADKLEYSTVEGTQKALEARDRKLQLIRELTDKPDDHPFPGAPEVLDAISRLTEVHPIAEPDLLARMPDYPRDGRLEDVTWNVGMVRRIVKVIAEHRHYPPEAVYHSMRKEALDEQVAARYERNLMVRAIQRCLRLRILAPEKSADRVHKEERHLNCLLFKTLGELRRMQASRREAQARRAREAQLSLNGGAAGAPGREVA
ncbi:MAG: hypothetical protein ACE15C_06310 [Phycisphaerae bacterium]